MGLSSTKTGNDGLFPLLLKKLNRIRLVRFPTVGWHGTGSVCLSFSFILLRVHTQKGLSFL